MKPDRRRIVRAAAEAVVVAAASAEAVVAVAVVAEAVVAPAAAVGAAAGAVTNPEGTKQDLPERSQAAPAFLFCGAKCSLEL